MKKIVKIAAIVVAVVLVIALVAPMVLRGKIAEIVRQQNVLSKETTVTN